MSDDEYFDRGNFFVLRPEDMEGLTDTQIVQLEKVKSVLDDLALNSSQVEGALVEGVIENYDADKRSALNGVFQEELGKFGVLMLGLATMHVEDGEWGEGLFLSLSSDLREMSVDMPDEFAPSEVTAIQDLYAQEVKEGDSTLLASLSLPVGIETLGTRYSSMLKDDFCDRLEQLAQDPEHNVTPMFQ